MKFSRQPYSRPIKSPVKSLITVVCMVKEFFVDRHTDIYTHRHIHTSKLISFQLSYLDQDACKPSTAY